MEQTQNEKEKPDFNPAELKFIDLLADGLTFDEAKPSLLDAPFNLSEDQVLEMYKNASILQEIIERASDRLGQVWGTMWREIRKKAMLGSVPHAKLLIEHKAGGKNNIPWDKLRIGFED